MIISPVQRNYVPSSPYMRGKEPSETDGRSKRGSSKKMKQSDGFAENRSSFVSSNSRTKLGQDQGSQEPKRGSSKEGYNLMNMSKKENIE
jgi:hypothetical protein